MTIPPHKPTQRDALEAMIAKTKRRNFVPIRQGFVQLGDPPLVAGGPIAAICSHRDERALDLYLLLLLVTTMGTYTTTMEAGGWARALGFDATTNNLAKVSKTFGRLDETYHLINRGRVGNTAQYSLLMETGLGELYIHPSKTPNPQDYYFKLPHAYWLNGWFEKLSLRGKVLLLISLSRPPGFILPKRQGSSWYAPIGENTIQTGLAELVQHGLLSERKHPKLAPLTTAGITMETRYTLMGDFAKSTRKKADIISIDTKIAV